MARELTDRDIREGFWYYRPKENFPPAGVREPEQYDGGKVLTVDCTQTELPPREQTKLVNRWCSLLPTLAAVEFVWFNSQVPQRLFDAACRIPNLQGLYVKWSSIKEITALAHCKQLKFFHLGSASQLQSINPLRELKELVWLELENIKRISDISAIGELQSLSGLQLSGSMWTVQLVDSLSPIAKLHGLRHLYLINLKAKDKTLKTLLPLKSLERFSSALWWTEDEVRQLYDVNPKLQRADFNHFVSSKAFLNEGLSKAA